MQPAPLALGNNGSYGYAPINNANNQQPIMTRNSVKKIGAARNKQDQAAGIFRNKGVAKNEIPKAG